MKTDTSKLADFAMCVCLNKYSREVAVCGWDAKVKKFVHLDVDRGVHFDATHFVEYPEDEEWEL